MKNHKPVLLCILDGWGIGNESDSNAISLAKTPNYKRFLQTYPNSQLETSGLAVGLPEGQMGNSEVGHMTIGAGRVIFQDLPRINNAIKDGSLAKNPQLQKLIAQKNEGKTCHLMGLLSDGGVHSHIDHIIFLAEFLAKNGVKVLLHAFLDGRDVAQKSAIGYLEQCKNIEIATISGRYYAMDRDKKWDRIELATNAIISAQGERFSDAISAVKKSYEENLTDEFIKPCVIGEYSGIKDGDALLFCNFRADRARQISEKLSTLQLLSLSKDQGDASVFSHALALTEYSEKLNNFYEILFPSVEIKNSLPEILSARGLTQLRIAETEKYAHVTFFFSCGQEKEFLGEERILIKSPAVATYDLKPEMSSHEVGEKLCAAIASEKFDFIVVNYANPDMVGHSGMLDPSIKAVESIDAQLAQLEKIILEKDGLMLISADHGNIECMLDENHQPHTSHTTNPVPFILVGKNVDNLKLSNGALCDIAPTILNLMQLPQPKEMSGRNLLETVKFS
ncbi:MAG: 2,3-bisphosphoglycerate-independent phosphoglycerate mutase [Proteobacteria bacterium]|nr:2,3-bisphosphoglycerate-independent phosphoglycerate mutase [Pseudomonadota bacterium]